MTKSKLRTPTGSGQSPPLNRLTVESDPSVLQVIRTKFYGKELHEYELSSNSLPRIVEALVVRLYSSTVFLQAEGIMRKSSDVEQLAILEDNIWENQKNYEDFLR